MGRSLKHGDLYALTIEANQGSGSELAAAGLSVDGFAGHDMSPFRATCALPVQLAEQSRPEDLPTRSTIVRDLLDLPESQAT